MRTSPNIEENRKEFVRNEKLAKAKVGDRVMLREGSVKPTESPKGRIEYVDKSLRGPIVTVKLDKSGEKIIVGQRSIDRLNGKFF